MDTKELKSFLQWRIRTDAVDATTACEMMGIKRPSLTAMIERGDIKGRKWDELWWFPEKEVTKNILRDGEKRRGRPRSGAA